MNASDNEREVSRKVLDLLRQDMSHQPITAKIATNLMSQFLERLQGFAGAGFAPASVKELELTLDELFGESLRVLKATSIHSNHRDLASYKGYWEHRELGKFFRGKNEEFLKRGTGQVMMRVYACDALSDSVAEPWFNVTVLQHVRDGAQVKVVQIVANQTDTLEDFGIYEHQVGNSDAGTYLLLAPRKENLEAQELRTAVTANPVQVKAYQDKFDLLWSQSDRPLEIVQSEQLNEANGQSFATYGTGCINDLFEKRIVLRKMTRLDTQKRLVPEAAGFIRKYQPKYARAVSEHIKSSFPDVKHLFYVGDTYKNDGTAIRNLQAEGWDVTGFICEPKLKIGQLWFNSVLYTDRWTDLIEFVERVREKPIARSLAIFDIDQTLWAPKGVADEPLNNTRIQAILKLVDEYVESSKGKVAEDMAKRAKARIEGLYDEISDVKYLNTLTLDNEDYKAAICVFLALNVIWDQKKLESGDTETGAAFLKELSLRKPDRFLEYVRKEYLPTFVRPDSDGEANMTQFMVASLSAAETKQFTTYSVDNGLNPQRILADVRDIFREMIGTSTVKYRPFRVLELQEALALTKIDDPRNGLTLNKPAWDLASWLKDRGVTLLGLSDRPDEATIMPNDGENLLNANMTIYGKPITRYISKM